MIVKMTEIWVIRNLRYDLRMLPVQAVKNEKTSEFFDITTKNPEAR